MFGDLEDTGILRIEETYKHPTENYCISVLVDVLIGLQLHNENTEDSEENTFIVCTHYADVTINNSKDMEDVTIQDINSNTLACIVKKDEVNLQLNNKVVPHTCKGFVWDGCHKLYLITSDEEENYAKELKYIVDGSNKENEILHPLSELETYYLKSCSLRFIESIGTGSLESMKQFIPQCTDCPMFIYY